MPTNTTRGGHGHKNLKQVIIAKNGALKLNIIDKTNQKTTILLKNYQTGVYLPKMTWREIKFLSKKTICLVLASEKYKNQDYIHTFAAFKKYIYKSPV